MGMRKTLKDEAFDLSRWAMERLLADKKRPKAVANALGTACH
jgi:hypothetical protein